MSSEGGIVARSAQLVRPASADDLPAIHALAEELRRGDPRFNRVGRAASEARRAAAEERFREALSPQDSARLLVVEADSAVIGMALLSRLDIRAVHDVPSVHVTLMCVNRGHRGRGAGRALLVAAAAWAEEVGAESVTVSVLPGARESHRYFTRLGFSPLVVLRTAHVAGLRRRLSPEQPTAVLADTLHLARGRGRSTRQALSARRCARERAAALAANESSSEA